MAITCDASGPVEKTSGKQHENAEVAYVAHWPVLRLTASQKSGTRPKTIAWRRKCVAQPPQQSNITTRTRDANHQGWQAKVSNKNAGARKAGQGPPLFDICRALQKQFFWASAANWQSSSGTAMAGAHSFPLAESWLNPAWIFSSGDKSDMS